MCVIEPSPILETRRLLLRAPDRGDVDRFVELAGDWDVARMLSRMPHPYLPEHAEEFLGACEAFDPAQDQVFAIELEDEGVIGVIGLNPHEAGTELGYWIGRPYWGRGLVSEAVDATLAWAKRAWKRRHIVAGHYTDNPASGRVLCKAGFLYTGRLELRDSLARGEKVPTRMMVWLA
ncbi:RimJ/RimL family protein N-acetyltransferase [Caulobacter ginsengisoli]|uniref:RimJ/RimL family protein N-acetyltransferase n=1 Tax=Caulobacter ginsengisoli TaxID=400775 RepID=A0ABU0IWT2_9CAUL|nr:GNAT family N-acetyltransferase [Caulobacter ginsengisoli]MDQ0466476.1 RimJ/RimL family protein N-acetyltransferase [Caulobacter ginsengisoli]